MTALVGLAWLSMVEHGELVPDHWRADAVVALVWLGIVMVAGQTLVMASVRRVRAETSASLLLFNPLTAAVLGVTLLGESLTTSQALGALLVLTGMASASGLFTVVRRRRRAVPPRAGRSEPRRRQMRRL
jgi:drug/metabolite transporter (DMT)-like permease